MASVNKVILVGNLGHSPEIRYSPDGAAICSFSMATTSTWKDKKTGARVEETEWHRVVLYNRLAEIAGEYLKKGRSVYIEGRLKTRKWQHRTTKADHYTTEVIGESMQLLGGAGEGTGPAREHQAEQRVAGGSKRDDDIPFAQHGARSATLSV